jgi:UDP-N-acetylmuramoyl-L-alanyl-D-glutamate--2,6-diaminopimelate ligase
MSAAMKSMSSPTADARTPMALRELLGGIAPAEQLQSLGELRICDLTLDSREVRPGGAFIALPGTREHGMRHAADAVQRGASVVIYQPPADVPSLTVPAIAIPALRDALGAIADRFFGSPSASMRIAAVTGTNGKTTTAWLIAAALHQLGITSAYAGTLGVGALDALRPRQHTTPDSITLHRELARLRDERTQSAVMEVSSHALDQARIAGIRIATAAFTNLTRDHLEYHGTLEAYGDAKAKLFRAPDLQCGVINAGDAFGRTLLTRLAGELPLIAYSRAQSAFAHPQVPQLLIEDVMHGEGGLEVMIGGDFGRGLLRSRLIGTFNAENLIASLGVLLSWNVELAGGIDALSRVNAPPGRMQTFTRPGQPLAVVDYAHTPDALEKALRAARAHCKGELVCVFGCGGERDPGKRPLMGRIAADLADRIILTDDNPRGESGVEIVHQILSGMPTTAHAEVERDRAKAIRLALEGAGEGDVVLVAGKGHEDYQIVGSERRHFSDAEIISAWLEAHA